jgi:elongation factor Ts
MSNISAAAVKALRDRTNLPMMDCKAALTAANGDMDKAIEELRKKFAGVAVKRGDRETAEGRICVWIAPDMKSGTIVEMRCESPTVVKADAFVQLGNDLAKHITEKNPADVAALLTQPLGSGTVTDRINEAIGLIRENM